MKKSILIIVGVVVFVILVGAGGFWGGMTYQTNQDSQAQARFFEQRGQPPSDGQMPAGMQSRSGDQMTGGFFRGGGGTIGEVKSIDGNTLTLSTPQDVTTVNLSDSTKIVKSVEGTNDDLQPGVRVMVTGETDVNGNITATQITIVNNDAFTAPANTAP
jgi:hypothetical protein